MSILFPLGFQYRKGEESKSDGWSITTYLLVNPTDISIAKRPSIAEYRTMGGTVFQPWVNQPDEVTFKGIMYGTRSIKDFLTLQKTVDGNPQYREVRLIYKWRVHPGYIKGMTVSAVSDKPRMFDYSFTFVSKKAFSLARMMMGQVTSTRTEADWVKAQYYGLKSALREMSKDPLIGAIGVASITQAISGVGGGYGIESLANEQEIMNSEPEDDNFIPWSGIK